jgi:hypothetical protein
LPEVNSFLPECQPFCNIAWGLICGNSDTVTDVTDVNFSSPAGGGLTQANLVSTLEQSPERGDTAATGE